MTTEFLNARLGVISPDDGINDDDFWAYLPAKVNLLFTRYRTPMRFDPISIPMVTTYGDIDTLHDEAVNLRITRPSAVFLACNSASFVRGVGNDLKIIEAIERGANAPATTISTAQVAALRLMGVKRVAIAGPYPQEVTLRLGDFLTGSGFEVTTVQSAGMDTEWKIGNAKPQVWADLARQVDSPEAECIIIAGSGTRTAPILDALERELDKPILSGPGVAIWHALRLAGVPSRVLGRGRLLANY
jgi:maleate isomerase